MAVVTKTLYIITLIGSTLLGIFSLLGESYFWAAIFLIYGFVAWIKLTNKNPFQKFLKNRN